MKIILGSQSKNRKAILESMGYDFEVMPANIDEKKIRFADPKELVLALASAKATALVPKIKKPTILITSDQVVVWNGQIRGKPNTEEQAREYLLSYAQHPAETITSVVVTNIETGKRAEGVDIAKVYFKPIPNEIIEQYIQEGDPFSHAGGFSAEQTLLAPYILRIDGTLDSVMGLPKKLTEQSIEEVK